MHTVLIVEDDKAHQNAIIEKLLQEKLNPLVASDGEEGLEVAKKEHPDAILLDMIMPRLNGLEFLKKLREDEWGEKVPVIVLTNLEPDALTQEELKSLHPKEIFIKSNINLNSVVEKINAVCKV